MMSTIWKKAVPSLKNVAISRVSARKVGAVSTTGKTPPSLDEFDPLNPGEWQLGAGGKILPRLPEGTRCGSLVMGKYGLYDPKLRKRVEAYSAGLDAGLKSEEATPYDARLTFALKIMSFFAFIMAIHNLACITTGKLLWPWPLILKKKE